ncbi:MAG: alpha/beta hydrolase family protein [Anaerolineae bacterium]
MPHSWRVLAVLLLTTLLAACAGDATPVTVRLAATVAAPEMVAATTEAPTAAATASATATAMATASPTSTGTATPTVTATSTATPTPTPLAPMSIEAMRQGDYPGSRITIEEELEPGANYRRYIASYLSEGLRIYALLTVPEGEKPESGWPVIVFNHGYIPPKVYRTTERYVAYVDGFARGGYIVLKSDYRGHGDSEGEAAGAYGYPDYTVDVLNAVASLKRFADADP